MNDARAIARELAELGVRLADLAERVEKLKGSGSEPNPSNGTALLSAREVAERTAMRASTT